MAEELKIATGSKEERYSLLYEQMKALLADEEDEVARMANAAAMIHFTLIYAVCSTGSSLIIWNSKVVLPVLRKP